MKKAHFGVVLFVLGSIGYLILRLYLATNPCVYNGIGGTYGALIGNELMAPYIIFCTMAIVGLIVCIYETFFRKK